jgi:hypothetical protein|tara:strand:+ start:2322 stop:2669 length:348 start_codon:yes stop_codon:yes gene_type:complete
MQRFISKKLTFENIAAMADEQTPVDKQLEVAPEQVVSAVKKCFLDVWSGLRTEFSMEQLSDPKTTDLPNIKSNIRKTIAGSSLSSAYKKLLTKDVDDSDTSMDLLDKINRYIRQY